MSVTEETPEENAPSRWREYLREGIVIVVSILVAFGVDALWDEHQDRQAEQRILEELRIELNDARDRIERSIAELEAVLIANRDMLSRLGPDTPVMTPAEASALYLAMTNMNTLEVPQSVLDSVVSSGQFRLISDAELRRHLARWPSLIEDVRENHEWHRVNTDDVLLPMMAPYVAIRTSTQETFRTSAVRLGSEPDSALLPGTSSFELDPVGIQRSPEFEAMLAGRMSRQGATVIESYVLLEATDELIALVEKELR